MFRSGNLWRGVGQLVAGLLAASASVLSVNAQTSSSTPASARIALLAYRPGSDDLLLMATSDGRSQLEAQLVRTTGGGRVEPVRTLPGRFAAVAWLDDTHVVTGGDDGRLASWPIDGGGPTVLATLPEAIQGIGVAPVSRNLALRLSGTLRLVAPDGRPNGPTITLGQAARSDEVCPPDGMERTPAFSPDEQLLVFCGLCGDLRVIGPGGVRLVQADGRRPYVKRYVFSAEGRTLMAAYPGGVDIVPVAPGRFGDARTLEADDFLDIAVLPNKQGFVGLSAGQLHFLDADGNPVHDDPVAAGASRMAVAADGSRIAVAADEGLVLLDGNGQRLARPFGDFGLPIATRAVAGGTQMAALHGDGRLRIWQLDGSESRDALQLWKSRAASDDAVPPRLFASPSGRKVGVLAPDGQFEVFDQNWNRVGRPIRFPVGPSDKAPAATLLLDDRILRPMPDGSGFLVLDLDGRVLGRMAFGDQQKLVPEAATASAGVIAIYTSDGRLAAWSREGRPILQRKLTVSNLSAPSLDISADGKTIVLHDAPANLPSHLLVWKLDSEDSLESRDGRFAGLLADGSLLRVSGNHLVLDTPDGRQRLSLPFDGDRVVGMTPDGKFALVAKRNGVRAVAISSESP